MVSDRIAPELGGEVVDLSAVERLLRDLIPQANAILARRCRDFAAAEDAVQDASLAATRQWPGEGLPTDPLAWVIRVAARRLTDRARSEAARRRRELRVAADTELLNGRDIYGDDTAKDGSLDLLFICCHPSLTTASAIALTLRAVGGLTTEEIAHAFLAPVAAMAQRIARAKQTIRSAGARFERPEGPERQARLVAVLRVLYLMFNEGYAASGGSTVVRDDLAIEAIRLTRMALASQPEEPEVEGLLALMLLTESRRAARVDDRGGLVPLDLQDRRLWDRSMIAEGVNQLNSALSRGAVGPYQVQAAIAALHDEAATTDQTDWPQILLLYGLLRRMSANPLIELNRAVALAMVHGAAAGLQCLNALSSDARVAGSHRLAATRAHLLELTGRRTEAAEYYRQAAAKTGSLPEREYLLMKAARIALGEPLAELP